MSSHEETQKSKAQNQAKHSGERKHICPICDRGFTTKFPFTNHLKTHSLDRPYECPTCNKSFKRRDILNRHVLIHTDQKLFICPTCSKEFTQKSYLNLHMRVHYWGKQYECEICLKQFLHKRSLTDHLEIHYEGEFICPNCNKTFVKKKYLETHVRRMHLGEKHHTCEICQQTFNRKNELLRHTKNHFIVKPFVCCTCEKGFFKETGLKRHITYSHLSHICETCKKRFAGRNNLINHLKIHETEQQTRKKRLETEKKEVDGQIKPVFCFEVPLVKEEIDSEDENMINEQKPSSSYQYIVKEEVNDNFDPLSIDKYEES